MKKNLFFLFAICLLAGIQSHAQVAINTDSSKADPSAILDLKSSNKGLLLPRMKDISTNPIANPTTGLIVFDSATNKNWIYNLYGWEPQTPFNLPFSGEYYSITTPLVITNHGGHAISALSYGPYTSAGYFYGDSGALSMQMRGPLQIFDNGEAAGKVLTSDAQGVATWQAPKAGSGVGFKAYLASEDNGRTLGSFKTVELSDYYDAVFDDSTGFNAATGIYTAPSTGLYHFDVKVDYRNPTENNTLPVGNYIVGLEVNGFGAENSRTMAQLIGGFYSSLTLSANLQLQKGDQVQLEFTNFGNYTIGIDDGYQSTFFSGYKVY